MSASLTRSPEPVVANGATLTSWASQLAPQLDLVSASTSEPALCDGDVIAMLASADEARRLVRDWERLEPADRDVTFVAFGCAPDTSGGQRSTPDPEGVTSDAAGRAAVGAAIGAVVGVIVVLGVVAIGGWGAAALAGVVGGAAFGAVAGAVTAFVARTGWGDSYLHSYVDPDATDFAVCAITPTSSEHREQAIDAAHAASARRVWEVRIGRDLRRR